MWAPPPSGYVDECICQIDRSNAVRYVVQDASYDVVAIVAPQTQSVASKVSEQYTRDPYGQVLTAEYSGLEPLGKTKGQWERWWERFVCPWRHMAAPPDPSPSAAILVCPRGVRRNSRVGRGLAPFDAEWRGSEKAGEGI